MTNPSIGLMAPSHLIPVLMEALEPCGLSTAFAFDPSQQEKMGLTQTSVILVLLSPAIEDALDPYEDLLYADGQQALFDENQGRDDWDARKWSDHLVPKITPMIALARKQGEGAKAGPLPSHTPDAGKAGETENRDGLHDVLAMNLLDAGNPVLEPAIADMDVPASLELELAATISDATAATPELLGIETAPTLHDSPVPETDSDKSMTLGLEMGWEADPDSPLFGMDEDEEENSGPAIPPAQPEDGSPEKTVLHLQNEPEGAAANHAWTLELDDSDTPASESSTTVTGPSPLLPSTHGLSLVMDEDEAASASTPATEMGQTPPADETTSTDPLDPAYDKATEELAQDANQALAWEAPPAEGFVLIVGGMGGPAAIREILSHLNQRMPVPVLIHQPMPQGRYDVLATNLGKHASLPVRYAEPGTVLEPGQAWVLEEGLAPSLDESAQWVAQQGSASDAVARAGESQSAILMVSGASQELIFPTMEAIAMGATVFGQEPERAYESNTIEALLDLGLVAGSPTTLGIHLAEHWGITDTGDGERGENRPQS